MPRKTFTAGDVLTASDVNTFLSNEITLVSSTATAVSVVADDRYKTLMFTNASAVTVTFGTATEFEPGERVDIIQDGAGTVTITTDSTAVTLAGGGTSGTAFEVGSQYDAVSVVCVDTNSYRVIGLPSAAPSASGLVHISTISFSGSSGESFNNVFSSTYDNYMIVGSGNTTLNDYINFRMRVAGVDNSTASSYITQLDEVANTTSDLSKVTQTAGRITRWQAAATARGGFTAFVYDPFAAVVTSVRSTDKSTSTPAIRDFAIHHTQEVSYDGITFLPNSGTMTGSISIYGLAKA